MRNPEISVVICTRNRGDSIVETLESVFSNQHPYYEVIVVDQSTNETTQNAIEPFISDHRFRYFRSDSVGLGRSRNIGLQKASGEIVAYTDDDCVVPADWLCKLQSAFQVDLQIAVVFCSVTAGIHDCSQGYIPTFEVTENRLAGRIDDVLGGIGLGAGMAVSRQISGDLGGFDNSLGLEARFFAGEDHDIAIRALLRGYKIHYFAETFVTHSGFRTWQEGRSHTRHYWFSGGATYIKPLKCGYPEGSKMLFSKPILNGLIEPIQDIFQFRRPRGLMRPINLLNGLIAGLLTPVDREKMLYTNRGNTAIETTKPQLAAEIDE